MGLRINQLDISPSAKAGEWFTLDDRKDAIELLIVSSEFQDYKDELEANETKASNKILTSIKNGQKRSVELDHNQMRDIRIEALAHHILKDWKGVDGEDGKPAPCNLFNRRAALKVRYFREMVLRFAQMVEIFDPQELEQAEEEQEDLKNSPDSPAPALSEANPSQQ